jgi:hypothetical protein
MNSETKHQLYGGEISDYLIKNNTPIIIDNGIDGQTAKDLEQIYNTQVKGKPSIDTTGIYNNSGLPPIARDPHFDKIGRDLTNTLNVISQQLGLNAEPSNINIKHKATSIQNQTDQDIAAANTSVLQALKELKDLNAI